MGRKEARDHDTKHEHAVGKWELDAGSKKAAGVSGKRQRNASPATNSPREEAKEPRAGVAKGEHRPSAAAFAEPAQKVARLDGLDSRSGVGMEQPQLGVPRVSADINTFAFVKAYGDANVGWEDIKTMMTTEGGWSDKKAYKKAIVSKRGERQIPHFFHDKDVSKFVASENGLPNSALLVDPNSTKNFILELRPPNMPVMHITIARWRTNGFDIWCLKRLNKIEGCDIRKLPLFCHAIFWQVAAQVGFQRPNWFKSQDINIKDERLFNWLLEANQYHGDISKLRPVTVKDIKRMRDAVSMNDYPGVSRGSVGSNSHNKSHAMSSGELKDDATVSATGQLDEALLLQQNALMQQAFAAQAMALRNPSLGFSPDMLAFAKQSMQYNAALPQMALMQSQALAGIAPFQMQLQQQLQMQQIQQMQQMQAMAAMGIPPLMGGAYGLGVDLSTLSSTDTEGQKLAKGSLGSGIADILAAASSLEERGE